MHHRSLRSAAKGQLNSKCITFSISKLVLWHTLMCLGDMHAIQIVLPLYYY